MEKLVVLKVSFNETVRFPFIFDMETLPHNAVFLIIDIQKGFDEPVWVERISPEAENNI